MNLKIWDRNSDLLEIRDLLLTVGVLSFIVAYTSIKTIFTHTFLVNFLLFAFLLFFSFVTHEMAHKYAALHFNFYARFEMWWEGLLFSFLLKLLTGYTLLVPGAVIVYPKYAMRKERMRKLSGIISAAGPFTNIFISLVSILLLLLFPNMPDLLLFSLKQLAYFNSFLAIFNLIPLPPLDGFKVIRWSIPIYLVLISLASVFYYLSYISL